MFDVSNIACPRNGTPIGRLGQIIAGLEHKWNRPEAFHTLSLWATETLATLTLFQRIRAHPRHP
jgi:hypothetical protein